MGATPEEIAATVAECRLEVAGRPSKTTRNAIADVVVALADQLTSANARAVEWVRREEGDGVAADLVDYLRAVSP